jgi:Dual specificity phosphatase, catalytic domain
MMDRNGQHSPFEESHLGSLLKRAGLPLNVLEPEDIGVPATARGYQVTERILVSHWIPAFNRDFIENFGVKSVLSLDGKHSPSFASELGLHRIVATEIPDGKGTTPEMVLHLVGHLRDLVQNDPAVLVHCNAGQSRSPSIVAAYLAMHEGYSLDAALRLVAQARAPLRAVKYWPETLAAIRTAMGG